MGARQANRQQDARAAGGEPKALAGLHAVESGGAASAATGMEDQVGYGEDEPTGEGDGGGPLGHDSGVHVQLLHAPCRPCVGGAQTERRGAQDANFPCRLAAVQHRAEVDVAARLPGVGKETRACF